MEPIVHATYTLPWPVNFFLLSAGFGIFLAGIAAITRALGNIE